MLGSKVRAGRLGAQSWDRQSKRSTPKAFASEQAPTSNDQRSTPNWKKTRGFSDLRWNFRLRTLRLEGRRAKEVRGKVGSWSDKLLLSKFYFLLFFSGTPGDADRAPCRQRRLRQS